MVKHSFIKEGNAGRRVRRLPLPVPGSEGAAGWWGGTFTGAGTGYRWQD
jgi:hypothetical protein